ncbi:MAG: transcriptional regulator PpsR [Pseudomonadota bacterium]
MKSFRTPQEFLAAVHVDATANLLATAADLAIVLGPNGVVEDLAVSDTDLEELGVEGWIGKRLEDTVSADTRPKVPELLAQAPTDAPSAWRQLNHVARSRDSADVPVNYAAQRLGAGGQIMLIGRNLGAISKLQQRLVEAQQTLERDYSRIRMAETRYRLLFQTTAEAVLIVDANTEKVLEANPATRELLGEAGRGIVGRRLLDCFEASAAQAIGTMLSTIRGAGRASEVTVNGADGDPSLLVGASMFRQDANPCFLVRVTLPERREGGASGDGTSHFLSLIDRAPEAFVVTDHDTHIQAANPAFADLAQLASVDQANGKPLETWLGRPGVDTNVLLSHLRQHGSVRHYETNLRPEIGPPVTVELSAVMVSNGEAAATYGFTIRHTVRAQASNGDGRELPRSVEQLTELVGRVPLKELVRETTDVIERLCIEAALELTEDNRASAAEMLGLSRQSLYVKLRRYGLGDLASDSDGESPQPARDT